MQLLNRLIARYGSADGVVVNNRRIAIALPRPNIPAALVSFWFYSHGGAAISGVSEVTLVVFNSAGERDEKDFALVQNRISFGVDAEFLPPASYTAWFELSSPTTGYLRTDPFELHILP